MITFNKDEFTKSQLAAAKNFEQARKKLIKAGLVLNVDAGQLGLYRKEDWTKAEGNVGSIKTVILIDCPAMDSTDCLTYDDYE